MACLILRRTFDRACPSMKLGIMPPLRMSREDALVIVAGTLGGGDRGTCESQQRQ